MTQGFAYIVEVYTGPAAKTYRSKTSHCRGDEIQLQRHHEVTIPVCDFLLPHKG